MTARLSPDEGVRLLAGALSTGAALAALIVAVGPVSGAHLNPAVSLVDGLLGGLGRREVCAYVAAQAAGAMLGTAVGNLMFELPVVGPSAVARGGAGQWLAEVVATAGLVLVIFGTVRGGAGRGVAAAVGAYIAAAYFFTSSTSFANPAVTLARTLTDAPAGIAVSDAPAFVLAQLVGAAAGLGLVRLLHPHATTHAEGVVVPRVDA